MRTLDRPLGRDGVSRFDSVERRLLEPKFGGAKTYPVMRSGARLCTWAPPPPVTPVVPDWALTTLCEAGRLRPVFERVAPAARSVQFFTESLILAQDERWRRA